MQLNQPHSTRSKSEVSRPPQYTSAGAGRPLVDRREGADPLDKRQVFKQMVVGALESGFLRYSKRKALLDYASRIGITEFDAMLLIAEAQFYADQIDPKQVDLALVMDESPRVEIFTPGTKLTIALGTAVALDIALICWLFV
jgi:hypothetical protein